MREKEENPGLELEPEERWDILAEQLHQGWEITPPLRKGIIWVHLRYSRVFGPELVFTQTLLIDFKDERLSLVVKNDSIQKGSSGPFLFLVKHCFYH